MSAPLPAWWSLVKDQPCTPRTFCAVGLHPEPLYRSGQQGVHQHCWPEERGAAVRLVTSRSGCTSRPGDPRPNPQGADRPYLLLSIREKCHQQRPTAWDLQRQARQAAERSVTGQTDEGHRRRVQRPLLSVARITKAGHQVFLGEDKASVKDNKTMQITNLRRERAQRVDV